MLWLVKNKVCKGKTKEAYPSPLSRKFLKIKLKFLHFNVRATLVLLHTLQDFAVSEIFGQDHNLQL